MIISFINSQWARFFTKTVNLLKDLTKKMESMEALLKLAEYFLSKKQYSICIFFYQKLIQYINSELMSRFSNSKNHSKLLVSPNPFIKIARKLANQKRRVSGKQYIEELNQASEISILKMKYKNSQRQSQLQNNDGNLSFF